MRDPGSGRDTRSRPGRRPEWATVILPGAKSEHMADGRDPVQRVADESDDGLRGVVYPTEGTILDRVAAVVHRVAAAGWRALLVLFAALILAGQLALTAAVAGRQPVVGAYILLSAMPAFGLAAYVWRLDVTGRQPLSGLVATFLLGMLFAGFAAELNGALGGVLGVVLGAAGVGEGVGLVLLYFLVVGPAEETVKLLAVRLGAYRSAAFGAVVDGAVYGAMAGLGFATIENAAYITNNVLRLGADGSVVVDTFRIAAVRSFAGPGHVIYSAFAGYYLGLAKFNPERGGATATKGLLLAAFAHGTYNAAVTHLPALGGVLPVGEGVLFIGFVIVYDGALGYFLYRKIDAYRRAFRRTGAGADPGPGAFPVARTEFDPPTDGGGSDETGDR